METAPTTGLSDASESADSDAFSPVWPRDSSDKSEGTSDDSSFEDKMEPRHRAPDVQLKLPEGRTAKGSEGENEEVFEEQGARAASEAGLKMSEEVAALKREGAALKAVPFGEIVSSSGAEDTAEESATEDDSMAGGMDLDSSETEMLAGGAREQPPGRSWKWFERFMGKKKADAPESKGLASEKGKAPRSRKGPAKKGLVDDKGGFGSFPTVEKSPLGLSSGQGGRAELGAGAQFGRTSPAKGLAKEAPSETNMEKPLGELETARFRVESGDRLAQGGGIVKAVCEYEAAIRLFRSQSDGVAGRRALQGEAQAWEKIAALQKQEENGAAAGRGYLSAARVYQKLGMEAEMGACLQQARELQKMEGGDEEVAKTGQKAGLEGKGARKENEEKDSEEKKGTLEGDADDETTRGTREFGLGNTSVEQDKVLPGQGSTVALSGSPQSVQSSNMQDLAQGLVYSNEEAKGASSKRAPKKKGKGPTTKSTPESGVAKTAPGERSDDGVQAETTQPRPTVSPGAPAKNRDLVGSGTAGGASQADTAASIARSRKFGAAAVASGDADKGKALLVGALVAARKGGVKAEEARCLRLLADSQATDDQRVRTLEQAVQGMHDSGLRLEEAEALYRLADTKLTQYLGNKAAIQAAVSGMPGREEVALVESARTSLLAAAQILQGADLWKGPETAPERTPREILSPTRTNRPEVVTIPARGKFAARNGRGGENAENGVTFGKRGPSVGVPIKVGGPGLSGRNPDEVRVLRELYGQVCQGVGKASILLGQMGAAKEKFQEALSNVEWTSKYGDEAKRVQDIMGRLPR